MSITIALLAATIGLPLVLLMACTVRPVRERMLNFLPYVPLPALATALLGAHGEALVLGNARLPLAFALDQPGAIVLGVAALLWIAGGAYAATSMRGRPDAGRFAVCWLMTLAGCMGVYLAADMVGFYGLLALLSVGASCLVMHDATPDARRAGAIYLGLALLAEAFMLMAFVMLATIAPNNSLWIGDAAAALAGSPWRNAVLALLVIGFGMKAGMVPTHFFMPLAYRAAPIPAAAVVSGAVVKASVLGLIRFLPHGVVLPDWGMVLAAIGFLGAFYGVVVGLTQAHPKTVLAYSSVSQLGYIVAIVGIGIAAGDDGARLVAAFYAANHVLVKGALFLAVGVISATGRRQLWLVLGPATVLALSLGGLPLTGGALTKAVAKGLMGDGMAATLATLSAIGSTMLMFHFIRCLRDAAMSKPEARAAIGMVVPWLAMVVASLVVPWILFLSAHGYALSDALNAKDVWSAFWPVMLGTLFAIGLPRGQKRLPRIPEGDLVVVLSLADRGASVISETFVTMDAALRRWPMASLSLLCVVLFFGVTLVAGR